MSTSGFPDGSAVKNPPAKAGDASSIPGSGRSPGEENGNPLQCSCLGNPHGQRSLAGYGPQGHKNQTRLGAKQQRQPHRSGRVFTEIKTPMGF